MRDKERIAELEEELELRQRTILFLIAEYAAENDGEKARIVAFLRGMIPEMPPRTAAVAQEILDELGKFWRGH